MASGFSFTGGQPRCFPFWQQFQKCYANAETPNECTLLAEDYIECLHGTKELARAKTIKSHWEKKQKELAHEQKNDQHSATDIVSLGLAQRERESKENESSTSSPEPKD